MLHTRIPEHIRAIVEAHKNETRNIIQPTELPAKVVRPRHIGYRARQIGVWPRKLAEITEEHLAKLRELGVKVPLSDSYHDRRNPYHLHVTVQDHIAGIGLKEALVRHADDPAFQEKLAATQAGYTAYREWAAKSRYGAAGRLILPRLIHGEVDDPRQSVYGVPTSHPEEGMGIFLVDVDPCHMERV